MSIIILSLLCSLTAVAIIVVAPLEPVFNWWFKIGNYIGSYLIEEEYGDKKIMVPRYKWFYKPIWGCEKCLAGQLALWIYLGLNIHSYNAILHFLCVCSSITLASIISNTYTLLNKKVNHDRNL